MSPMRVGIVTLGCDKNVVDNEYLAGLLTQRGHAVEVASAENPPDVVVITTCGFLDVARRQSLEEVEKWTGLRKSRGGVVTPRVAVIGCLAQRMGKELLEKYPGVDYLAGVGEFERVATMIEGAACPGGGFVAGPPKVEVRKLLPRRRLETAPHSFLKISDGCNHTCTFCAIPSMKGRHTSVQRDVLVAEAKRMIEDGIKEINIVAQDTAVYGTDFGGGPQLEQLLREICAIPGDFWVRIFYLYPTSVTDGLIELVATEPKIVKYLDIPLQHMDEDVLKAMKRPHDGARTRQLLKRIRERIPGIVLRTTFIIGFPGETEKMFRNLMDGIEEIRFERMGAFCFSPEEGTPAATLPKQVAEAVVTKRFDKLMRRQMEWSQEWTSKQVGTTRRVLIEGRTQNAGQYIGRSFSEAAEIDGFIAVRSTEPLTVGQFVDVKITEADVYDLAGDVVAGAAVGV